MKTKGVFSYVMDLFSSNPEPVKVNQRNRESMIVEKTKSSAVVITKTSLKENDDVRSIREEQDYLSR